MNLIRHTDSGFPVKLDKLIAASSLYAPAVEQRTGKIIRAVGQQGDKALLQFTEKVDGAKLTPRRLRVTPTRKSMPTRRPTRTTRC